MFKNLVTNVNQNEKKLLVNFSNEYYKKKTNVSNVDNDVDTVYCFFKKVNIQLPHDSAILLTSMYPK